jgi:hypothetical protein
LDLTLSATKTLSPLALISVLNSLVTNKNLKAVINKKLTALNLPGYNAQMIMNRAEAMSCSGCHHNSNDTDHFSAILFVVFCQ